MFNRTFAQTFIHTQHQGSSEGMLAYSSLDPHKHLKNKASRVAIKQSVLYYPPDLLQNSPQPRTIPFPRLSWTTRGSPVHSAGGQTWARGVPDLSVSFFTATLCLALRLYSAPLTWQI